MLPAMAMSTHFLGGQMLQLAAYTLPSLASPVRHGSFSVVPLGRILGSQQQHCEVVDLSGATVEWLQEPKYVTLCRFPKNPRATQALELDILRTLQGAVLKGRAALPWARASEGT